MDCNDYKDKIVSYIENELDESSKKEFENELENEKEFVLGIQKEDNIDKNRNEENAELLKQIGLSNRLISQ
jgi:hypothetical protein